MICIISATNRKKSKTSIVAAYYLERLKNETDSEVRYLSLESLPSTTFHHKMYEGEHQDPGLTSIQDEYIIPAEKLVIIAPEYNGGIPGVLKMFIDTLSVRRYHETFKGKKVCLVGVSSGRAGNLRGLEYLTSLFHYLGMNVYYLKLPISSIENVLSDENNIDSETRKSIEEQIKGFISY